MADTDTARLIAQARERVRLARAVGEYPFEAEDAQELMLSLADALERLQAERDEAKAMYYAENQNWMSMYEDNRASIARAEAAEARLAAAEETLRLIERSGHANPIDLADLARVYFAAQKTAA